VVKGRRRPAIARAVQPGACAIGSSDLLNADRPLPASAGAQSDRAGAWAVGVADLLPAS
jgi:hypothetical protein